MGQRTSVKSLNFEDRNTKFFHQTMVCRRNFNRVVKRKKANGEWNNDMDVVVGLMQEHLSKNVFQSKGCREIDEAL